MKSLIGPVAAALLALSVATPAGQAAERYRFTLVDAFVTDYSLRECYIWDINDAGVACGTATIRRQVPGGWSITYTGFYWTAANEKTPIELSWPKGISNSGMIGGVSQVYDMTSGQFTSLPLLSGTYPPLVILGVNDSGIAVGYVQTCNCSNSQGVLQVPYVWDAQSGARTLPVAGAKGAARINNRGQIVGWTGSWSMPDSYLYDLVTGQYLYMSSVFTGTNTQTTATDVNDDGVVVGWRLNANGSASAGYTWSAAEGVTLLPEAPAGYQPHVRPSSINRGRVVVGSIYTPTGSSRAFVCDESNTVRDLNALTEPPPDFVLMTATRVNDRGLIVGYGQGGGGMYKSFVLTPETPGDVNGDGRVDQADLGIMLANWQLAVPPNTHGDLNGDGRVDQADLGILLAHYGS